MECKIKFTLRGGGVLEREGEGGGGEGWVMRRGIRYSYGQPDNNWEMILLMGAFPFNSIFICLNGDIFTSANERSTPFYAFV